MSPLANNYFELSGKLALITGASSGLGYHFSKVLASAGCTVILAARRRDKLDSLAFEIDSAGGKAIALELDIADKTQCRSALNGVFEEQGAPDILLNNAGIAAAATFLNASDEDIQAVFDINQTGVWHMAQCVCQHMIEQKKEGSIINIASILGLDVMPGVASYAVSKAAVVQLTKVMALELARHKIRVNAIAPGYFSTDMNAEFLASDAGKRVINRIPARRPGKLDELNGLLLLLASTKSTYMTGTVIPIDGGHLVSGLA